MKKFLLLFFLTIAIVGCNKSKDAPYRINITNADVVYKKNFVTRGASNGEYYKIDKNGNESQLLLYTENGEVSTTSIYSIRKATTTTLIINGCYFADISNGILYESPFEISSDDYLFHADNGLLYHLKGYLSSGGHIYEINLNNYTYRDLLPDGQEPLYCAVDKDGLCMYVVGEDGKYDARFRLTTGRVVREDTIELEEEIDAQKNNTQAYDWFMHNGIIHRVVRYYQPYEHIGIYSYQEDNGKIVTKRVATHEIPSIWGTQKQHALIFSNIDNNNHYIIYACARNNNGGYYLFQFNGEEIVKVSDYSGSSVNILDIAKLYGRRFENLITNGYTWSGIKQVKTKPNPIFITNGEVYQLNTDYGFLHTICNFDLSTEYDIYNFQFQPGVDKAMFSGMRYFDGAIVAGEITFNEVDYNIDIKILKEEKSQCEFQNMINLGSFK